MIIYKADIIEKYGISFQEAKTVLDKVPQEAILEEHKSQYHFKIWDNVSPINGVSAETIRNKADYPNHFGHVSYFLYKGEDLVYFQYTNPVSSTMPYMTIDNVETIARSQIDDLCKQSATEEIWERIKIEMENL